MWLAYATFAPDTEHKGAKPLGRYDKRMGTPSIGDTIGATMNNDKFEVIAANLSPERPIRSSEFLRGRSGDLDNIDRELRYFHAVAFIYGYRGVGKTSLGY